MSNTITIKTTDSSTICQKGTRVEGVVGKRVSLLIEGSAPIVGVLSGSPAQMYFSSGSSEARALHKALALVGASREKPATITIEFVLE